MISAITSAVNNAPFRAQASKERSNPITEKGEKKLLLKATVGAGLVVGLRTLWYLAEDGFLFDNLFKMSKKITAKNKQGNKSAKTVAIFTLLCSGFVAATAALYTMYKAPNINYQGNINSFVKGKDMDVYIKGNKVEKELYNQMIEKSKNASSEEKDKLKEQYLKLKSAKNELSDSIKT